MALNYFEHCLQAPVKTETRYVLTLLGILSDQYGRVFDFDTRKIECLCDLGPRSVSIAIDELIKLKLINIPEPDFAQLILPNSYNGGNSNG